MIFLLGLKGGKKSLLKLIFLLIVLSVGSTEVFYCVHRNDTWKKVSPETYIFANSTECRIY